MFKPCNLHFAVMGKTASLSQVPQNQIRKARFTGPKLSSAPPSYCLPQGFFKPTPLFTN